MAVGSGRYILSVAAEQFPCKGIPRTVILRRSGSRAEGSMHFLAVAATGYIFNESARLACRGGAGAAHFAFRGSPRFQFETLHDLEQAL